MKTLRILAIGTALACTLSAQAEDKPNIILINIDDLGWTDLGAFGLLEGESLLTTPKLVEVESK